jgi:hypothetical protein
LQAFQTEQFIEQNLGVARQSQFFSSDTRQRIVRRFCNGLQETAGALGNRYSF